MRSQRSLRRTQVVRGAQQPQIVDVVGAAHCNWHDVIDLQAFS
jgi:hypothetical protein